MGKWLYIVISFTVSSALLLSCVNETKQTKMSSGVGQKLIIPTNLQVYEPFDNYSLDSSQIAKANLKLYVSIDFSCPTCVNKLNKWVQFMPVLASKRNIPIIVIANSHDRFELLKYLVKKEMVKKFPFPFFLDKENVYFIKNKIISESAGMNAVLTDKDNNILLYGDPLNFPEVKSVFINKINSLLTL